MAAMSVIGIDYGSESCYVAVAKAGGIETIANDYSLRATPSCIAFSGKNRILGVAAKNQQVTNMKNTVYGLKHLLGRKFRDPHVQKEIQLLPFCIIETDNGHIGIKVHYLNEEHIFTPEQCFAMLLTKLKDVSANALQTPINDCVISVPSYFTNNERKALLDSAAIAGLNVLRLFNETTATALSYGIYKQDLPPVEEKPRNVIFVDFGHSAFQVSACAFNKGKLKMLSTASASDLGGRNIDLILADYFCKEFQSKYKINAKSNARAFVRLLAEVEKLKKQMSANSTNLPLNIECFMEDKDVHGDMKRADMETMCANLFLKAELTIQKCLEKSGLTLDDIHSVEIAGGSSRIPAIKQVIEKVLKKVPCTSLNQDEAVARGCALQCAMLSPAVRVREFNITDLQDYPISVEWDDNGCGEVPGDIEVFPTNHAVPFSKILTFYRREPFSIKASYCGFVPYPDKLIGTWIIRDIKPGSDGKAQKVKVKVRINIHGIMTVSSASLIESKDEIMETEATVPQPEEEVQKQASGEQQVPPNEANGAPEEGEEKKEKKKKTVKSIDLPIEALTFGFSQVEINQYTEQEFKMIAADKQEKERADARNALEEYVYELRGKLSSDDELAPFVLEKHRDELVNQLSDMENWLYEEGEDCQRQEYQDKLSELKSKGEPIQLRRLEFELRNPVMEDFQRSLQLGMKAIEQILSADPKYSHLSNDDLQKVENAVNNSYKWLEQTRQTLLANPKHQIPPITVSQIKQEKLNYEGIINPILNKPPPKAKSPPKEEPKEQSKENNVDAKPDDQTNKPEPQQENMDCS